MLATLNETATVWFAVAALWALAAAWFTYHASVKARNRSIYEGLQNLTLGIKVELALISLWAGPQDDAPGYLKSKTAKEYFRDEPDWRNPDRIKYTFDYPTISDITSSPYVRFLQPIIGDFAILNYSLARMHDIYREFRQFVMSQPSLRQRVKPILTLEATGSPSPEEREFMQEVFDYNYRIHVECIGGKDSEDPRCLYASFRKANRSLQSFADQLKPLAPPKWHWALHLLAAIFVAAGTVLLTAWLMVPHLPS